MKRFLAAGLATLIMGCGSSYAPLEKPSQTELHRRRVHEMLVDITTMAAYVTRVNHGLPHLEQTERNVDSIYGERCFPSPQLMHFDEGRERTWGHIGRFVAAERFRRDVAAMNGNQYKRIVKIGERKYNNTIICVQLEARL